MKNIYTLYYTRILNNTNKTKRPRGEITKHFNMVFLKIATESYIRIHFT